MAKGKLSKSFNKAKAIGLLALTTLFSSCVTVWHVEYGNPPRKRPEQHQPAPERRPEQPQPPRDDKPRQNQPAPGHH